MGLTATRISRSEYFGFHSPHISVSRRAWTLVSNARIKSSSLLGPVMLRPVSTNPTGSIRPMTGSTTIPALVMTSITSRENTTPSASAAYDMTFIFRPEKCEANFDSSLPISFRASASKVRGWIDAFNLRLSVFNLSASLRNCSASLSFAEALSFRKLSIWWFVFRSPVSSRDDSIPTISSPATPVVTRTPPVMAQNFCHGNMAAGRLISSQNSTTSWRYSAIKPITTSAVKKNSQNPSPSKEFSDALAALSSADKSIDRYERRKRICLSLIVLALLFRLARDILFPMVMPTNARDWTAANQTAPLPKAVSILASFFLADILISSNHGSHHSAHQRQ